MKEFAGQWIGSFDGTNSGMVLVDLDLENEWLEGSFYAFDKDEALPNVLAPITVQPEGKNLDFSARVFPIHPQIPRLAETAELQGARFPSQLEAKLSLANDSMKGTWSTDVGTSGTVELHASRAGEPSQYSSEGGVISWEGFQAEVSKLSEEPYRFIFRGQSAPWRLRTSFHRTNRKDLWRFWNEDIPRVRHASVGKTPHLFDPANPDHNGAFMHLLQHHGYPTPMLDWTYSPYIAAYFAFASAPANGEDSPPVRIFMFDAQQWKEDFNQVLNVTLCHPHFSLLEPLAIGNDRALPQQSVAAVTNVDDVETYIEYQEKISGKSYLKVFDLSHDLRSKVLGQLGLMGISPGSLFPGIEGVCREYRDRHFGHRF